MKIQSKVFKDSLSIVLCGEAGQGIQTVEYLLTRMIKHSGFNVFSTKEYMSRIRGGNNSTEIYISSKPARAFFDKIDILIPLNKDSINHVKKRITKNTIIISDKKYIIETCKANIIEIPLLDLTSKIGNVIYANTIAIGLLSAICNIKIKFLSNYIMDFFSYKNKYIIEKNLKAAEEGYKIGLDIVKSGKIIVNIKKNYPISNEVLLSGIESISLGAIAGGCNFISSYPMSPSTGVLTFLSRNSTDFNIVAEQAEDEVSAINMAIGAWYAGGRAMVTTSGGGFALMVEGISLAGMLEIPIVVHIAQRPGPATGLPTRTEQADLEHVLYSGHGEFPKIIFAPGKIQDGFYLTQKAFNLADKYQIPVFILTDQYFVDSYYNLNPIDLSNVKNESYIVKTKKDYKRYKFVKNGISPRGIPGYGDGLVCVDSDEHNDEGHITENLDIRVKMVDKRLKKLDEIKKEVIQPDLIGNTNYKTLVLGWGSTYHLIKTALEKIGNNNIALLHFKQVYPIHQDTLSYLKRAENTIIIENNATSQFGKLINLQTGFKIQNRILKYNGLPFSVEELEEQINLILRG